MQNMLYELFTDEKKLINEELTPGREKMLKTAKKNKEYIILDSTNKIAYFTKNPPKE